MFSDDCSFAVRCEGISKEFELYEKPIDKALQLLRIGGKKKPDVFKALDSVSVSLRKGETLGIIGKNGSGKSTLLQVICGIIQQDRGQVISNGRICSLLELGSGFNPEFTGVENIRMNASILGLRKEEVERSLPGIIEFADIGSFVERPVKLYSSGMVVRLAFAVQAFLEPKVLVIDEALAVGDEMFQKKCFAHIRRLKAKGTAMVLVSHSVAQINAHCDSVMLLHRGRKVAYGKPHDVTSLYQRLLTERDEDWEDIIREEKEEMARDTLLRSQRERGGRSKGELEGSEQELNKKSEVRYPCNGAEIASVTTVQEGDESYLINADKDFEVVVEVVCRRDFDCVRLGVFLANKEERRVAGMGVPEDTRAGISMEKGYTYRIHIRMKNSLWPGIYFVGIGLTDAESKGEFIHRVIDAAGIRVISRRSEAMIGETKCDGKELKVESRRTE